ncbi:MAG: hypothetical protein GY855_10145, partial [candidate division Zixibacteria bacterium]|nr:hypothetical protein [candidate division Zixibacteria bacterium]
WGTGDLVFINDVFAKDYRSFFIGRDDQYLKAPQDAVRMEYYNPIGALSIVWSPRFEANRLPTGRRLSFYDPMSGGIVGVSATGIVTNPEAKFENSEFAGRLSRQLENFNTSLYFYHGFYKNPMGFDTNLMSAIYPRLNIFGVSSRGMVAGGVFWIEGGYLQTIDDENGDDPFLPNSSITGLIGFEKQLALHLTANIQWQASFMTDHDIYSQQQSGAGGYVREEVHHLVTTRITKLLYSELLKLSGFVFYSPDDEDSYIRFSAEYKYTDEVRVTIGGNLFDGKEVSTEFGQFQKNDNVFAKATYGF